MSASQRRSLPHVLASAVLLLGGFTALTRAQDAAPQPQPGEQKATERPGGQTKAQESKGQEKAAGGGSGQGQRFDPAVVSAGMAAFERSCTKCHDAGRSLERTKDLAGWRATVQRMAGKRGADIATGDIEPIATYLASRNAPASGTGDDQASAGAGDKDKAAAPASASDTSSVAMFATISPQWRGGNNDLQNPGFGPLAWVGASWQGKVVSARASVCISCHGVQEPGLNSRIEPVEIAVRVDLSQFLDSHIHGLKGSVDAGRFVVPFGAFSAQADPSLYRTVSTPLIFNMGQRLFNRDLGFPVLPMPYADEGLNLNLGVPLGCWCGSHPITATVDGYLVNGLEGGSNGIDFFQSRDLLDNNNRVAGGTRVTVGGPYVRAGASFMTGRLDIPATAGSLGGLDYTIYGCDVQAHYKRLFRCQFEYAHRDTDRVGIFANGPEVFAESTYGYYAEAEARPWDTCHVSFLVRYDSQKYSSPLPPSGSTLTSGHFNVERMTLGVNIELWHQSLLMFNYERWLTPEPDHRTSDVFGVRYTITF